MNKYLNDETAIPAIANARADIDLGKNLPLHMVEIMDGIVQIREYIDEERKRGSIVSVREEMLIAMMENVSEIRFKLKTAAVPDDTIYFNHHPITNLNVANQVLISGGDLRFHIATMSYDIDMLSLMMHQDLNDKVKTPDNVIDYMNALLKRRDAYQKIFNEV